MKRMVSGLLSLCLLCSAFVALAAFPTATAAAFDPEELVITETVGSLAQLNAAINRVPNNGAAVIGLDRDISVGTALNAIPAGRTITLVSVPVAPSRIFTITRTNNARHFTVNGTLILTNITLSSSNATGNVGRGGVEVSASGHLVMESGSRITNSRWTNGTTGAVRVNNGNMTMNGGEIAQNVTTTNATNRGGAGVFVTGTNATFTMNGGKIRDNHVTQTHPGSGSGGAAAAVAHGGGGVAIDGGGRFVMNGGEITENTVVTTVLNTSYQGGGGVLVGGNVAGGAVSRFEMNGGEIRDNRALYAGTGDIGPGEGGGVFVGPRGEFTMYGGVITRNLARSNARGGGGVFVAGGRFRTANRTDETGTPIITKKQIVDNRSRSHGGGVAVMLQENSLFNGIGGTGNEPSATIVEGTIIHDNLAGLEGDTSHGVGLGGGIVLFGGATLRMEGGEIAGNTALRPGGGIAALQNGTTVTMTGGTIYNNRARGDINTNNASNPSISDDRGNGGGVSLGAGVTWTMTGGTITGNTADFDGGGVRMAGGNFRMQAGEISCNLANDGGGLFVFRDNAAPNANLDNVTIDPAAVFTGNMARNGAQVNHTLAAHYRNQIRPGTVSVNWAPAFAVEPPHGFTNFDINATGQRFWRVSYEVGENVGQMTATVDGGDASVPSDTFVPEGTRVRFAAELAALFQGWSLGTRIDESLDFSWAYGGAEPQLALNITSHTHATGNFRAGITLTYDPNGGAGEPYVYWTFPGTHQVAHQVTHPGIDGVPYQFLGWNTRPDGSGISVANGDAITIIENLTLYAQWGQSVTALTVSKTVGGDLGNHTLAFAFTIRFTDTNGAPLAEGRQFSYTGSGDGTLDLDSDGSAIFWLTHGQTIRVEGVPLGGGVQIMETPDTNYATSFTDSARPNDVLFGTDTGEQVVTEGHAIHFTNERVFVPETGVYTGDLGATLLLPLLAGLVGVCIYGIPFFNRGKNTRWGVVANRQ